MLHVLLHILIWVGLFVGLVAGIGKASVKKPQEGKQNLDKRMMKIEGTYPYTKPMSEEDLTDMKEFFSDHGTKPSDYK